MAITKKGKREKQKRELRKRVVDARTLSAEDNDLDEYDDFLKETTFEEDMAEFEAAEKAIKKKKLSKLAKILIIIGSVVLLFCIWLFVERFIKYSSYSITSSSDSGTSGDKIEFFKDNLVKFSSSGIKYVNYDDEPIWESTANLNNPVFSFSKNYGIIYDADGTKVVVFDDESVLAEFSVDYPILNARISDQGVSAISVKDGNSNFVWFFDNIGTKLEIEIKNVLADGSGYPLGLDISPSGVGVAMPLMIIGGGSYKSCLTFYNFDKGKDSPNRIVGEFDYEKSVFPEIKYLSNSRAVAFGDNRICFYALSDAADPELKNEIVYDNEIVSVCTGEERAAVVSKNSAGGYLLTLYNDNGKVIDEENFAFDFSKLEIVNGYVLIYGSGSALIETTSGHLKYCGEMEGITISMIPISKGKFLQYGDYGTRTIRIP